MRHGMDTANNFFTVTIWNTSYQILVFVLNGKSEISLACATYIKQRIDSKSQ